MLSLKKIPVIVREATHRTQFGIASRINRIITQIAYNSAQSVVALSHGVGEDLISNFGVKKEKITVIYNPVDIAQIKYLSNEQINDLNFQDDEVLIIAVGRLEKEKDYPTLLKAFCIVRSRFKARLIILGSGLLERELKDMAHKLNLNGHINFLGFKKNPYKYFRKADIFVLSSKCEGFGHVIVEAMATGTPVISTDCESGPREIIGENECGVLVPVGDHKALAKEICSLIRDKEKCRMLALRGLERAEAFEAKTIVPKYEFLFMDVLNKSMQVAQ